LQDPGQANPSAGIEQGDRSVMMNLFQIATKNSGRIYYGIGFGQTCLPSDNIVDEQVGSYRFTAWELPMQRVRGTSGADDCVPPGKQASDHVSTNEPACAKNENAHDAHLLPPDAHLRDYHQPRPDQTHR
jgi:hypothetical protein